MTGVNRYILVTRSVTSLLRIVECCPILRNKSRAILEAYCFRGMPNNTHSDNDGTESGNHNGGGNGDGGDDGEDGDGRKDNRIGHGTWQTKGHVKTSKSRRK